MDNTEYLRNFFDEKVINEESWDLKDKTGQNHYISTDVVIEAIFNAPESEQAGIVTQLRKLDYHNQPIEPFLKHLAQGMINVYSDMR